MVLNSSTNDGLSTPINTGGTTDKAIGFTLPTGSDYNLDSITLRLQNYSTTAGDVARLRIYEDVNKTSTNPNGATLQSLLFNNPSSSSNTINDFIFTPTSTFTLKADTRYWLRVSATSGNYNWLGNNPPTTPTGIAVVESYQVSSNNGSSYSSSTNLNILDIQATPIPFDFDPSFGVAVLGGGWLLRKHLKKKQSTKV
ncbi:MAG: choice-of-anchor R domain-containing protein [Pseudanabaena sp. ELA607]